MDDILEFSKGIKDCQHCLSDVKFISHLKSNINKYGLTDQIKDLLQFEDTTLQLFKVETLSDMTALGATESLVNTIKYIYKKIEQFFAWVWKHLSALFERVKRSKINMEATQKNIERIFTFLLANKVDTTSSKFYDTLKDRYPDKDDIPKIISSAGANLHIDKINLLHKFLLFLTSSTRLTINDFEYQCNRLFDNDIFSKNNKYSWYIEKRNTPEWKVHITPFKDIIDFRLELVHESTWDLRSLTKLHTILSKELPDKLHSEQLSNATLSYFKGQYDGLKKDLDKQTKSSFNNTNDNTDMNEFTISLQDQLNICSMTVALLDHHFKEIEHYIYLTYSAAKEIYSVVK